MEILNPTIRDYLERLTPERDPVLRKMEAYARERRFPIIGPLVGRFLQQLVVLTGAKAIYEMGSGFGYSALWMARALPEGGLIECTELSKENIGHGRNYLAEAGVGDKVKWQEGDAVELMSSAVGPFDLILNDVDKHQYPQSLKVAWPKLRRGGVMVTDNSLWSGRVVSELEPTAATRGVLEINGAAYALTDAITTIIPLRDGLLMAVKK